MDKTMTFCSYDPLQCHKYAIKETVYYPSEFVGTSLHSDIPSDTKDTTRREIEFGLFLRK